MPHPIDINQIVGFSILLFGFVVITYEMRKISIVPHIGRIPDCRSKAKPPVKSFMAKRPDAKPFAKAWPEVLAYRMTHPDLSNVALWKYFKLRISDIENMNVFRAAILQKGLDKKSIQKAMSDKEMTKVAVQTFADKIKGRADKHLEACSVYLDKAHKVIEKVEPDLETIGGYMALVKDIHREGRLLYNVDEDKTSNPNLMNLALLVSIRPEDEEVKEADAIEV